MRFAFVAICDSSSQFVSIRLNFNLKVRTFRLNSLLKHRRGDATQCL